MPSAETVCEDGSRLDIDMERLFTDGAARHDRPRARLLVLLLAVATVAWFLHDAGLVDIEELARGIDAFYEERDQ